jgi:hypothetical protein
MPLLSLDRFQGALLGLYLGEFLGNQSFPVSAPCSRLLSLALDHAHPEQLWAATASSLAPESAILVAILPDVLAWHDHPDRWQQQLEMFRGAWPLSSEAIADCTLWGYGLTLLLRGKTSPSSLIPRLQTLLGDLATPLWQQLEQVQSALDRDRPFLTTASQLARSDSPVGGAIATSLYAFLQTPADFSLSLRRASYSPRQTGLITTLVGCWSGVYNGLQGCPISWRIQGQSSSLWKTIERQAEQLHAHWSGVDPTSPLPPFIALALAGTLQPRDRVKLISQEDF